MCLFIGNSTATLRPLWHGSYGVGTFHSIGSPHDALQSPLCPCFDQATSATGGVFASCEQYLGAIRGLWREGVVAKHWERRRDFPVAGTNRLFWNSSRTAKNYCISGANSRQGAITLGCRFYVEQRQGADNVTMGWIMQRELHGETAERMGHKVILTLPVLYRIIEGRKSI
ncbi:hypothetical protein PoB_001436800 [Plakobranchus ocellatus]|uniref:Uncharacterized protein n=1 Tax=Plakobranchus ocellatus TaxID=259542 RepID=A0AAV3Z031_9GAST|nr:hypothetical protein PoB_001436800 [Plakobranchus ocellatus]